MAIWVSVEVALEAIRRNSQAGLTSVKLRVDGDIIQTVVERLQKRMPLLKRLVIGINKNPAAVSAAKLYLFW